MRDSRSRRVLAFVAAAAFWGSLAVTGCDGGGSGEPANDGPAGPVVAELPLRVDDQRCAPVALNNQSRVLLSCANRDGTEPTYRIWGRDGDMRRVPVQRFAPGAEPVRTYFGENDTIAYSVSSSDTDEPGSLAAVQDLYFFDGQTTRALPRSFIDLSGMSSNGQYLLVLESEASGTEAGQDDGAGQEGSYALLNGFERIDLPQMSQGVSFVPTTVNDLGVVAGYCTIYTENHMFFAAFACRWNRGAIELLQPPGRPERSFTYSRIINNQGAVAAGFQSDVVDPSGVVISNSQAALYMPDGSIVKPASFGPGEMIAIDALNNNNIALASAPGDNTPAEGLLSHFLIVPGQGTVPLTDCLPAEAVALVHEGERYYPTGLNDGNEVILSVVNRGGEEVKRLLVRLEL